MTIFGRIEQLLEGLVEGIFSRSADNLPAAILRQLAAEIEGSVLERAGRRYAPPDCHIILTREAMRLVLPIQTELEEELRSALARFAARNGLVFPSPLQFKFGIGDGSGVAVISVGARFSDLPVEDDRPQSSEAGGDTEATRIFKRTAPKGKTRRAWLCVEEGPDLGREFQLTEGRMVAGRDISAHINLVDTNVSRRHAVFAHERGGYYLTDLHSTNGTMVNGRLSKTRHLQNGDRIKIGRTILIFREDD